MSECVAVLAVWEAPQGQLNAVVESMLFSSLDFGIVDDDEVASAVATYGRAMSQLRKLFINFIKPFPLLLALGDRDCPLEHVTMWSRPWVCTILVCVDRMMMQCNPKLLAVSEVVSS